MLRVVYKLADLDPETPVVLEESRGSVTISLSRLVYSEEGCAALNAVAEQFVDGGQWFQIWRGEIVSMESPEDPRQGGTVARLHRGPVVHEAS